MNSRLQNWREGVDHFNSGRYWDAHEAWERDWLKLPVHEKLHIQILIQVAGVFVLIGKNRFDGARSLLKSAIEKTEELGVLGGVGHVFPRVEIPDLLPSLKCLETTIGPGLMPVKFAPARLLLSPL